jgi:hypothetical protein
LRLTKERTRSQRSGTRFTYPSTETIIRLPSKGRAEPGKPGSDQRLVGSEQSAKKSKIPDPGSQSMGVTASWSHGVRCRIYLTATTKTHFNHGGLRLAPASTANYAGRNTPYPTKATITWAIAILDEPSTIWFLIPPTSSWISVLAQAPSEFALLPNQCAPFPQALPDNSAH